MTLTAVATLKPTCSARTGFEPDEYGFSPLWCMTQIGLRQVIDARGLPRWYCGAPGHEKAVRRMYGVAGACFLCGREDLIELGLYTRVRLETGAVVNLCADCAAKGDAE